MLGLNFKSLGRVRRDENIQARRKRGGHRRDGVAPFASLCFYVSARKLFRAHPVLPTEAIALSELFAKLKDWSGPSVALFSALEFGVGFLCALAVGQLCFYGYTMITKRTCSSLFG